MEYKLILHKCKVQNSPCTKRELGKNLLPNATEPVLPISGKHASSALLAALGFFEGKNDVKFFWFQVFAKRYLSVLKTNRLLDSRLVLQQMLCKGE